MKAGRLIIKTVLDNTGLDKGLAEIKAKGKLAGTNFSNLLGKGLKRALNLGKGLGKAFTVVLKSIVKISAAIGGIGLLLGGLLVGVGILGLGFKKAFENEQIKANIDYIKFAILKALEPAVNRIADVIVKIINLLFKIMQYINYIIYRWTGKNIFENASVDAYADSIKQADKNAKSLKKTLQTTGFDEMEILQDNSSAISGATGGGVMPDFDLSKIEDIKIPSWIKWIADNKDGILAFLAGLVTYLGLVKLGLSDIKALGFGLVIWGIVDAIQNLLKYLKDPTWENFGGVIEGIGLAVIGLGLIIGNLPLIVIGAIVLAFAELIKHWNEIKKWINDKVFGWFDEKIDKYRKQGFWGNLFAGILTEIKNFIRDITISFDMLFGGLRQQLDGFIKIFSGDMSGIPLLFRGTANTIIGILNTFSSLINLLFAPLRGLINEGAHLAGIKTNIGDYMKLPMLPRLAKGTIANAPGHGVLTPGRNALYGEAGREAYLPLSDEQLLEELGSSIGRHITLNLTNINKLNGRVLNRETKKIKSEDDFAYKG